MELHQYGDEDSIVIRAIFCFRFVDKDDWVFVNEERRGTKPRELKPTGIILWLY